VHCATLEHLRAEAARCQRCDLYRLGTQTVFGAGPGRAEVMFVGEQPGDAEDRAGQPFVGPAGGLLNDALAEAGIDRSTVYLTNVVKHFTTTVEADPAAERTPPSVTLCKIDGSVRTNDFGLLGRQDSEWLDDAAGVRIHYTWPSSAGMKCSRLASSAPPAVLSHLPFAPAAPPRLSPHHWRTWV
jgi:hypothetical protein